MVISKQYLRQLKIVTQNQIKSNKIRTNLTPSIIKETALSSSLLNNSLNYTVGKMISFKKLTRTLEVAAVRLDYSIYLLNELNINKNKIKFLDNSNNKFN
jgi:hypothetical protein